MEAKEKVHKMKEVKQISKQNSSLKNSPFSSTFPIYRKERPAHNVLSPTKWAHFLHIYTNRPIREVGQWFPKQTIPCRVGQRPRAPSFPHRTIKVEGGKRFQCLSKLQKRSVLELSASNDEFPVQKHDIPFGQCCEAIFPRGTTTCSSLSVS